MELMDLEIYQLSTELSQEVWKIYQRFDWRTEKIIGDQWITAVDSIGANIAEGFGRFHYLDKNKFNYNARGSLLEVEHWTTLLFQRNYIDASEKDSFIQKLEKIHFKLNNYINATKNQVK